mgnify:CR=1 FL=1|tara:strand:+ start:231 stop:464 length:234 start_codon:yes stop_codon:yes gene_type:complete
MNNDIRDMFKDPDQRRDVVEGLSNNDNNDNDYSGKEVADLTDSEVVIDDDIGFDELEVEEVALQPRKRLPADLPLYN